MVGIALSDIFGYFRSLGGRLSAEPLSKIALSIRCLHLPFTLFLLVGDSKYCFMGGLPNTYNIGVAGLFFCSPAIPSIGAK